MIEARHGQRRRHHLRVIIPTLIIVACIPLLIWELTLLLGALIG